MSVLVDHLPGARDTQGLRAAHGGSTPLRDLPAPNQWSSGCRAPRGRASCSSSRGEPRRGSVTSTAHVNNAGGDWSRCAAALAAESLTNQTEWRTTWPPPYHPARPLLRNFLHCSLPVKPAEFRLSQNPLRWVRARVFGSCVAGSGQDLGCQPSACSMVRSERASSSAVSSRSWRALSNQGR